MHDGYSTLVVTVNCYLIAVPARGFPSRRRVVLRALTGSHAAQPDPQTTGSNGTKHQGSASDGDENRPPRTGGTFSAIGGCRDNLCGQRQIREGADCQLRFIGEALVDLQHHQGITADVSRLVIN